MNNNNPSNTFYVVFRDTNRVSDDNHETMESAQKELDYWNRILKEWPDGTKVRIEERHRS